MGWVWWAGGLARRPGAWTAGHTSALSFARVAEHVELMKHLLSATLAPMSAKNCLDNAMPCTARDACWNLLAYSSRSSANTLGSTCASLM